MSFLSHHEQNHMADTVFEPFYAEFPYDLEQIKKITPSIQLEDLAKPAVLKVHFGCISPLTKAKKMLAHFMWQQLNNMADTFQQDRNRPTDNTKLIEHLDAVKKLMRDGIRINQAIEAHFKKKYYLGMSSRLEGRFDAVIKFCDNLSKSHRAKKYPSFFSEDSCSSNSETTELLHDSRSSTKTLPSLSM